MDSTGANSGPVRSSIERITGPLYWKLENRTTFLPSQTPAPREHASENARNRPHGLSDGVAGHTEVRYVRAGFVLFMKEMVLVGKETVFVGKETAAVGKEVAPMGRGIAPVRKETTALRTAMASPRNAAASDGSAGAPPRSTAASQGNTTARARGVMGGVMGGDGAERSVMAARADSPVPARERAPRASEGNGRRSGRTAPPCPPAHAVCSSDGRRSFRRFRRRSASSHRARTAACS